MLTDARLAAMLERLAPIPHLRRLRIHTRLPIVLPDRVTPELIDLLRSTRLTPIMVVHANHPAEIARRLPRCAGVARAVRHHDAQPGGPAARHQR